jgi:hypothetical protein
MRNTDSDIIVKARRFASDYYRKRKDDPEHQGHHPSHLASEAINAASKKFNIGYGAEGFCDECGKDGVTYLNMGDTYDYTVLFTSENERFFTGSWGDYIEAHPEYLGES